MRQKRKISDELPVVGNLPPQATAVEKDVLGTILLFKDGYDLASAVLSPNCFYDDRHGKIYQAMQDLSRASRPIDHNTVAEQLRKADALETVGGEHYLRVLTNSVVSNANLETHCQIIYEKFLKRELIRLGGKMVIDSYSDSVDVFELMDEFEKDYQNLTSARGQDIADLSGVLVERMTRMVELQKKDSHVTGVTTGFHSLDLVTHGWQPTDLIILAARPSVGKTAFALNLARAAANSGVPVGLFSLEMSKGQLADRMISAESEVYLDKITTGKMEEHYLKVIFQRGIQPLAGMKVFIDDTAALNVFELRAKARRLKQKYNIGLIIIDYLQLMSGVEDRRINNREQEISNISRNLKKLAKELNVPIIALSQLSRAVEQRGGQKKEPQLSDLRESGAIEQDADTVMFMYRPEYYDIHSDEQGESTQGLTEISIKKHRHGRLASGPEAIKLRAKLEIQKFVPWEGGLPAPTVPAGPGAWRPFTKERDDDDF